MIHNWPSSKGWHRATLGKIEPTTQAVVMESAVRPKYICSSLYREGLHIVGYWSYQRNALNYTCFNPRFFKCMFKWMFLKLIFLNVRF